jgi:hypothetical protein
MRTHPIASLGVLLGVAGLLAAIAPAAAQKSKTYALKVSVHRDAQQLSDAQVDDILSSASKLLQSNGNECSNVSFTRNGHVQTFSNGSGIVDSPTARDEVFQVDGDIKVVKDITYCNPALNTDTFKGCTYPYGTSMAPPGKSSSIVGQRWVTTALQHVVWAHEFGHRTGLPHRGDDLDALMSACGHVSIERKVNQNECQSFLSGPCEAGSAACMRPIPLRQCADDRP